MKVLYVIDSLRPGGKERQAVALVTGLAARRVDVEVVSMGADRFFAFELERNGIPIHYLLRSSRWDMRPCHVLNRIVTAFRPDVVHTSCWMTSLFALPVCRAHHLPLVNGSIRNTFDSGGARWTLERWLLRRSDARIANTHAGFRSRGLAVDAPGNHVVYNGFAPSRISHFDAATVAEMRTIANGRKLVGMVAQFKPDKDYITFCEAATRITRQRDDVVFITVGDGPTFAALKASYATRSGHIVFLGRRTHIESIINCLYLGVLATFTEGLSNAIIEFMAMGKPVVATDGGGTRELLVDGVTGWLVPPRDVTALVQKITYFLDRPDDAMKFGERGRTCIRDVFSIDSLIRGTLDVYREVLVNANREIATETIAL